MRYGADRQKERAAPHGRRPGIRRDPVQLAAFRRTIFYDADNADAHERIGNILTVYGREAEAAEAYRKVAALSPDTALGLMSRAKVLLVEGRTEDAEACLHMAIAREPGKGEAYRFLGTVYRERGRFEEAIGVLERATDAQPGLATAYYDITVAKRITADDQPLVDQMRTLLRVEGMTDAYKEVLHFGLGKALDDLGDYAGAIRHFDAGNALSRLTMKFDRAGYGAGINRLIDTFDAAFFARNSALGSASETPILILPLTAAD